MALRIRENGEVVCAAMHPEMPGDTYLTDGQHYAISVVCRSLKATPDGRWRFVEHGTRDLEADESEHVRKWPGEVCKRCHRRNVVGFIVPDETWSAVVRGRWNVLCPTCFDEEAEAAGVKYRFLESFPVSWSDWADDTELCGGESDQ